MSDTDDLVLNAVLVLVVAAAATAALASCLRRHARTDDDDDDDDPPSFLSAALASLHLSVARTVPSTAQQRSLAVPAPAAEQQDHKSMRSKERRRRGKGPFRDLLKGGKKSKTLLKALKATDHDHSTPSADTLSNASMPLNDTASSTSRSQSPDPAGDSSAMDRLVPPPSLESDDGSVRSMTPNEHSSSTSAATDISDHGSVDADSQTDGISTRSAPPNSMTATDTEANVSPTSTTIPHASDDASSSPPVSTTPEVILTPQPRDSQAVYTSGSCAKLVRARTRLRLSRMDPSVKSALLSSPLPDTVASPIDSVRLIVTCPSLSTIRSTSHSGPSTPTISRESTPPPLSPSTPEDPGQSDPNTQPLDQSVASAHAQLASMRCALEAAHLREEQLRIEVEQASKERDELRWSWNEDASAWRRREAELQAHIHHLMQQLQAYAAVASFQAQQAPSGFSSPTSPHTHSSPRLQQHPLAPFPLPPVMQTQNSTSAPAHVQALLASPVLPSHPAGFSAPSGGFYSGTGFGMSPLLWSGLGLCVPNRDARHGGRLTPDSLASGSSSGGQRPRRADNAKNPSDESSLGDWDGVEDGSGDEDPWEEEEDIFRNNALADAILKRPESIRELSSAGRRPSVPRPMHGSGVTERMDTLKDPALDKSSFVSPPVDTPTINQ